jgi:biopolymer transport protein ExbB/TolQ
MMNFEIYVDFVLVLLLAATVVYCFVLNRRIGSLRRAQGEFETLLQKFTQATQQAEVSLAKLHQAGDEIGADLERKINDGRDLHDELSIITQTGNGLADRIERGLVGRDRAGETTPAVRQEDERSESERELIEALRQAR